MGSKIVENVTINNKPVVVEVEYVVYCQDNDHNEWEISRHLDKESAIVSMEKAHQNALGNGDWWNFFIEEE